jgi:hypothetical protein
METFKRVLGEEHLDMPTSMNNLAFTFKAQGHNDKAISLMEKCFQFRTQDLGPQHLYPLARREPKRRRPAHKH